MSESAWLRTISLSFLFSSFSFLFLSSLKCSKAKKGCQGLIQVGSKPRTENILTGEVFRRCRTAAYKFQNSDSEDSAQIQAKFLYFQSCLLFFKFNPGEGRDILYITLSPFCEIQFLSIYFIYLKLIDLNANK